MPKGSRCNLAEKEINMTRVHSIFPRNFVGFDALFDELEQFRMSSQTNETYPPYNIIKSGDNQYAIEIAVAGFSKDDIQIEAEDRELKVTASKEKKEAEYLHKGISTKSFTRTFRLADHVQVVGADLSDGMLSIELEVILPDEKKPKLIPIGGGKQADLEFLQESA
jgi:molecular chaperone IbpA